MMLNEQDLRDNLKFLRVPEASIDLIRTKVAMKIYDEYANILRGMYSTRLNVIPSRTSPDYKELSLLLCMP